MARMTVCLLLLASLLAAASAEVVPFTDDTPVVTKQLVLDAGAFPAARPPLWPFRTVDTASEATCKAKGNGWKLTIQHKDLKGVTPAMMLWLYKNLASGQSTHPVDKQKYPNFLLLHPRDHILHTVETPPFALKALTRWIEFPLTGCKKVSADPKNYDYKCPTSPDANPGWLKETNGTWDKLEQANGTSNVRRLKDNGIRFAFRGCSRPPDGGPCAWVTKTTHDWKPNKATGDLTIQTTLRIGIGMRGPDQKVTDGWRNGIDPELKCNRAKLHIIEEIGGLENWLPAAYKEAGN